MNSPQAEQPYGRVDFDPWLVINSLRRRLPIFLTILGVFLLMAFGYTLLQKPTYTARVALLLDPRPKEVVSSPTNTDSAPLATMDLDTQVAVLTSTVMAKRVSDKLNLQNTPEFKSPEMGPEQILARKVQAVRSGTNYVINVLVETGNPKLSAKIAQAYGDAYIEKQISDRASSNDSALAWLDGRLTTLRTQAEADDGALQAYKVNHNLMSVMSTQGNTMAEQEISSLNQQISAAKADLSEKRARRDSAVSRTGDVAESLSTDLIRNLRKQRTDIATDLAKLRVNYGPKFPEVVKDEQQIAEIDAQIEAENRRTLASLNAEVRIAEQRYASLMGSHSDASSSLKSNNVAEVGLMELQRKADASHTIYESFLNRARELSAQIGLQQPGASIIENAVVPDSPSSPNMKVNMAFGMLMGLLVGGAYIGMAELLDHTYKSGREVATDLKLRNLVSIPLIETKGAKDRTSVLTYVLDKPYSLFSEAFRSLRTQINLASRKYAVQVIAVTSALPGEGKSLTCLSLARAMAANGSKVMLIDADLRRFSLTKYLNVNPTYGLQDVFKTPHLINESIVVDEVSGAGMILVPHSSRNVSTEVFTSELFEQMVAHLRKSYDYIILDTAPVLALSDIRVISAVADTMLLVVRWNKTPKDAVTLAVNILEESEAHVLGVCLNQVNMRSSAAHGYGDSLHYFNNFKEYWSDKDA